MAPEVFTGGARLVTVVLRGSPRLRAVSALGHAMAAVAILTVAPPGTMMAGVLLAATVLALVALSAIDVDRRHGCRSGAGAVRAVILDPVRGDRLRFGSGVEVEVRARAGARVAPCLILAVLESTAGRHALVVTDDAVSADGRWALARWLQT